MPENKKIHINILTNLLNLLRNVLNYYVLLRNVLKKRKIH